MIVPTVWVDVGVVLIYGSHIDADYHQHVALQVIWPQHEHTYELNGNTLHGLTIIASKQSHCLQIQKGWLVLVEPTSRLGEQLTTLLKAQPFLHVHESADKSMRSPKDREEAYNRLSPLFQSLSIDSTSLRLNQSLVTDRRIQCLLNELNACFAAECIKPKHWRAADVAQTLHLCESRFLHLFKAQIGIAWRPFLLWRRLNCALQALIKGCSATDAAYIAGFSDGAHLSRTFRATFGMSIVQAKANWVTKD
ncbi:AraC family transcriptional regulator [Pseudoalteromonas sp. SCSIO 43201]|uniref:AraC family transcriptional regulator n=1 Tax=Pseudoalteromonas sp. SCSIO 43201 TaxID=2822842 RepID=UPI0020753BC0|nr:helix-turn-helix domain-containing protein [Pseudoalteromonas sp. SCSIO 43201]USD29339.1 AraC family transcriptional regulator [Pseudoalteromonas sp. SCSIO 43201]